MVAINTNIASLLAQNNTRQVNNELEKAMERLSSGLRINSAGDDAAGLAISSRMEAQVRGLQAAIKNANDGISVTQVAEGAMEEVGNILQRMRELAVQAANDSNSDADRAYLQAEVSQLAEEITRISSTTQFNGQNILDGSYQDKYFQIGANASQNVGLSIANLAADSLGIGTSSTTTSTTTTTSTAVTEEIARLEFAFDDTYSFNLTDRETGLNYQIQKDATTAAAAAVSASLHTITLTDHGFKTGDEVVVSQANTGTRYVIKIDEDTIQLASSKGDAINGTAVDLTSSNTTLTQSGLTLNLEDSQSKADFEDRVNAGLKESAVNTMITGYANSDAATLAAASGSADSATVDLTTIDSDHFKFTLSLDGVTQEVDFLNRAMAAATTDTAATYFEVTKGMRNQIQSQFDDSVTVSYSSAGVFTIEDAQGRAMSVEQGDGTGYFFGTDSKNSGSIDVEANTANNLSVAFDGSDLVISHAAAGGVDLTNYTTSVTGGSGSTTYNIFSPSSGATSALTTPVVLAHQTAGISNDISISGKITDSKIALNFSDTFGYADDGGGSVGDIQALYSFELTDGNGNIYATLTDLDVQADNKTDATIVAAVNTALSSLSKADTLIGADEFKVEYTSGVLTIANTAGRQLAIENFSSDYGKITVSKLDGLEGSETLSNKQALSSEIRLTRGFGTNLSAGSAKMTVALDAATAQTVDIISAFTSTADGWTQAAAIETAMQTAFDDFVRVAFDANEDQFVITDVNGREINFSAFSSDASVGQLLVETSVVGQANKANDVDISTTAVSGVMTEAASLKLTLSQDTLENTGFSLNGVALTASDFNFATQSFSGSDFESALDQLMTSLNAVYDGSPISYSMDEDSRAITITHAYGGELKVSDIVTDNSSLSIDAVVLSGEGDDDKTLALFENLTSASVVGDGQVDGVASTSTNSSSSTISTTGISQISIATQEGANSALASIDSALETVLNERSMLGALESRLDHTINNLSNIVTNTSAAKGRIMDADFAVETANLTKNQILSQAATSMLAQANQSKQSILALLQ
ncbi:flagellin [Alphaproteobacteria bacterium]|nr:flagellin [Alphaproteobacteria bacterium]